MAEPALTQVPTGKDIMLLYRNSHYRFIEFNNEGNLIIPETEMRLIRYCLDSVVNLFGFIQHYYHVGFILPCWFHSSLYLVGFILPCWFHSSLYLVGFILPCWFHSSLYLVGFILPCWFHSSLYLVGFTSLLHILFTKLY